MKKRNDQDRFLRELDATRDAYRVDVREFIGFMKERRLLLLKALGEYADWLDQEHDGKILSPAAINRKLAAAKSRIRYAFKNSTAAGSRNKAHRLEEIMKEVRSKRIDSKTPPPDSVVSGEEIRRLLAESKDRGVKLMVRFLVGTGVQLSDMLAVKLTDLRPVDENFVEITFSAKGQKDRVVHIKSEFIGRVRECFAGHTYLFEHEGKAFSRSSAASRIRQEALNVIGRSVSPDQLRHRWAEAQIERGKDVKIIAAGLGRLDAGSVEVEAEEPTSRPTQAAANGE